MRKTLNQSIKSRIDKYPKGGSDRKMFEGILSQIETRFSGVDFFTLELSEIYSIDIYTLRSIVTQIIGDKNGGKGFRLISDQLEKWDYHEFCCPLLYKDIKIIENKVTIIRESLEEFIEFIEIDHGKYFNDLLESTYEKRYLIIGEYLSCKITDKESYKLAKEEFKSRMNREVLPLYKKLIKSMVDNVAKKKSISTDLMQRFNKARHLFELSVRNLTVLSKKHTQMEEIA